MRSFLTGKRKPKILSDQPLRYASSGTFHNGKPGEGLWKARFQAFAREREDGSDVLLCIDMTAQEYVAIREAMDAAIAAAAIYAAFGYPEYSMDHYRAKGPV